MNKTWISLGIVLVMAMCYSGCSEIKKCEEVEAAIWDLRSDDELVVRSAIRKLHDLADGKCVLMSVRPLAEVLNDADKKHDIHTRSLVPTTLSRIARFRKRWNIAEKVLQPLLDTLFREHSDLLRSKTALALGNCGWVEVLRPLKIASVTDKSVLVRSAAEMAIGTLSSLNTTTTTQSSSPPFGGLNLLNSNQEQSGERKTISISNNNMMIESASDRAQSQQTCITPEQYELIRKHVLVPDQVEISVCDE